ncbi:hypothetical protein R1sor_014150 [Riccia sorocarpa]|uniref:alanine--glyoxylate transaminase n=1 Tax=Riccia sorocarpa TaxID=122646 RepID=A0ABD3HAI3_9MARC
MAEYFPGPGRNHLFVPGPTNIPERVMQAMSRQNEDHRSPAFPVFSKSLVEDTKRLFKSAKGTCFIMPTTGSGGWECALTNTLSPGDRILTYRMHSYKAVCIVHNETSTAVTNDIGGMREVIDELGHPALLLVDAVSSIGGIDFRMDEWGVDVALTGSQKALSMPCGLGIICASPKALEASKSAKSLRCFFDWADYLKCYNSGSWWPYTPAIQLLYGLRAALDMLFEEGLDNVIARHRRLGEATRLAVKAWGLKLCTTNPTWYSDTVTSVMVPPHIDSGTVVKLAWKKYNLSLGIGLGDLAGKAFRIGHIGNLNELQLLGALAGVELVLNEVGIKVPLGSGVVAAGAHLSKSTPLIVSRL